MSWGQLRRWCQSGCVIYAILAGKMIGHDNRVLILSAAGIVTMTLCAWTPNRRKAPRLSGDGQ